MKYTYIIWSPQGEAPPTVTFNYRWKAENAAKRLSVAHPNQVFHVCKIKSATISGQSAYFGKWRPQNNKSGAQKRKKNVLGNHHPQCNERCYEDLGIHHIANSEADLVDEQKYDMSVYYHPKGGM